MKKKDYSIKSELLVDPGKKAIDKFLAAIVKSSNDAIISLTLDGVITSWNRSAEKLYGYTAKETIGKTITLLVPRDQFKDNPLALKYLASKQFRLGTVHHFETEGRRKNGRRVPLLLTLSAIRDSLDKVIGASVIARDITTHKEAEAKTNGLAEIIQKNPEPVLVTNREGIITYVNSAWEKLTGWTSAEVVNRKTPRILKSGKQTTQFYAHFWKMITSGKTFLGEIINRRKNGEEYNAEQFVMPLRNEQEEIIAFVEFTRDISERKWVSELLRKSEERLRLLIENLPVCVHEIDLSGRFISMNPSGLKMMGVRTESQICGTFYIDAVSKEDRKRIGILFSRALAGEASQFEFRAASKGEPRIFSSSFIPLREKSGRIQKIIGVTDDITQRRNTEINLAKSEANYRSIFDSVSDLVVVHEIETGRPIDINEAVVKRFGWSKEEYLRLKVEDWSEGHPPYSQKEAFQWIRKAATGKPQVFDWLCKTRKKELFWVEVSLKRATINGIDRILAVVRDISERKKAEAELHLYRKHLEDLIKERTGELEESRNQYKTIVENAPGMVYTSRHPHSLDVLGKHIQALTGYSLQDLQRRKMNWLDLVHADDKKKFIQEVRILESRPSSLRQEYRICKRNGQIIWVADNKKSVFKGKKFLSIEGIITNIDNQKKAEQQIKDQVEQLKSLDQLKNQFLSNVSHELRTPLTPIISQIQRIMVRELPPDEERASLSMILKNTFRLDKMINEVLEISRIQSGRMMLVKRQTNIRDLIGHIVETMEPFAKEKNSFITISLPKIRSMQIDPDRISSVIINLIDNAIKFNGGGEILVNAEVKKKEVVFSIRDHGIGIPSKDFSKIFTPFFRSEETHIYRGCGLGLSICKGIVEAHGGKIWFESKVGVGSTFYFSIPLRQKLEKKIEQKEMKS